ncbi:MAG: ATP-binding protein [Phaeospirillum sp.]|nr:ATP-binding protein [Phaeospirillum sp.]
MTRKSLSLTIRQRLHLAVALLGLVWVGNTIVLAHSYLRTANALDDIRMVEQSIGNIFESSLFVRDYLAGYDDRAMLQWREAHRRLGQNLDRFRLSPLETEGERLIGRRLIDNHVILGSLFDRLVAGHRSGGRGSDEAEKLIEQSLLMRASIMIADAYKLSAINNAVIARERQTFVLMLVGAVVVSALVGLFIMAVNRRILSSLGILRQASERIGGQDFVTPITLAGGDEFTELARAMNAMSAEVARFYGELRESEERYLLLFERSPQPMWVYDEHSLKFLAVNHRAIEHYGFTHDEFDAMTLQDIRPAEDVPALLRTVFSAERGESVGEWRHRIKNGAIIDVAIHSVPIAYGGHHARIVLIQDITERKRAEADLAEGARLLEAQARQLKSANEELGQFVSVASHDLRGPLRMVTSYMKLLEQHLGDGLDDEGREFMGFARDGAKRMDRLILDLLEYSRIGHTIEESQSVDLAEIAAQAVADLHFVIAEAQGRVDIADLPRVFGHPNELGRLFHNLVGNALKYRSADHAPVVKIAAARNGRDWIVSVADNGIGIAPEYFEKIFGMFQRLHGHGQYEGTGIGLANCKKIIEHHDGRIWVDSRPGEGSTFFFTLPAGQDAAL